MNVLIEKSDAGCFSFAKLDFLWNPQAATFWLRRLAVEVAGQALAWLSITRAYNRGMSYEYANTARDFAIVAAVLDAASWPLCILYGFKIWVPPEGPTKLTFALTTTELLSDVAQLATSVALLGGELYDQNDLVVIAIVFFWLSVITLWVSLVFALGPQYAVGR